MDTSKIRALGWHGGGAALLEETIARLAETMPLRPTIFSASALSRPS
jgi:hypothetical protein